MRANIDNAVFDSLECDGREFKEEKVMRMKGKKRSGVVALGVMFLMVGSYDARGGDQATGVAETEDSLEIPVDPVVEEPIRSLGIAAVDRLPGPDFAECGAMNGFVLPIGVLLASSLGWIPRGRVRCAAALETEHVQSRRSSTP